VTSGRLASRLMEVLDDPRATAEERVRHAAHAEKRFAASYGRGALMGAIAALALGGTAFVIGGPGTRVLGATGLILAVSLLAGSWLSKRWADQPFNVVVYNLVVGVVAAGALGMAAGQGDGFRSYAAATLCLFWIYGTTLAATRPIHQAAGIVLHAVSFSLFAGLGRGADGFVTFSGAVACAGGACLLTARIRDAAELRRFVDVRRERLAVDELEAANRDLERHAAELARLVDERLEHVLARRRDVQRLHRMLHAQDADRSQELSAALAQERPMHAEGRLPDGRVVGGRARILKFIASGGFGDVYLAEDLTLREEVILKVLHADGPPDPARIKRFVLEAAAAATARHPSIVRIFHVDVERSGVPFLVCERVTGETLRSCAARGAMPAEVAVPIFTVIADALGAVHASNLVHRDIKPDNVMVGTVAPEVRLLDFGVSRWVGEDFALTNAGELIGSVGYMSPEQIAHKNDVGPACDVFALGLCLWECLAGEHPFASLVPAAILHMLSEASIPDVRTKAPDVPDDLHALLGRMLAKDPAARPDTRAIVAALRDHARRRRCFSLEEAAKWLLGRAHFSTHARQVAAHAATIAADEDSKA